MPAAAAQRCSAHNNIIYRGAYIYPPHGRNGAVEPDRLPGWAKGKAAALRQDYQREKAAEKQRLEEFLTARREKETSENLRRPRAAQTRGREKRRGAMMELEIQTMQPGERLYAYRT